MLRWLFVVFPLFVWAAQTSDSAEQFYHTPIGEKIMDPTTHSVGIRSFLKEEHRFVMQLLSNYDCLFEIGCSASERALVVAAMGCKFYGIDINHMYISKSRQHFQEWDIEKVADVRVFSANSLNIRNLPFEIRKKTLILFPFNLMGNLVDFHIVLENMVEIGSDFCFSTYKIQKYVQESREQYYRSCGCQQLRYTTTPIGDLFDSGEGLHSAAFRLGYLMELLSNLLEKNQKKAEIRIIDLAGLGHMIYVKDILSLQS
jgi:hypothetical protein